MALAYTAPTWTDGSGEGISAVNLQAISNCLEGLVQGSDKAVHTISITGSVITLTFADGTQETVTASGLKGILSIEKTSTVGYVDTYTITYTDGSTDTFDVTNGEDGATGPQGETGPQGSPGPTGTGIASVVKTGTSGLVDTYTITFTDTTTTTFTITNGADGDDGHDGNKWYIGTAVSGKSPTPAVFPTGITQAYENDLYLNNSEGAVYHCVTGGDATTATWVYDFTLSGGGGGGTDDYNDLLNKPQINGTELSGNKSLADIGLESKASSAGGTAVSLVTTGEKYTWAMKVDQVSAPFAGTASSSSMTYQRLAVTDGGATSYTEIKGTKYMKSSNKQTNNGKDTFTFTGHDFTGDILDFYCDVYGISPTAVTASSSMLTVEFDSNQDLTTCRVYIKN